MSEIKTKVCAACKLDLPVSNFYFRKENNDYRSCCKKCKHVNSREQLSGRVNAETKICKHCGIEKPTIQYNKAGGGKWFQPYCKVCDSERKKQYHLKNKDIVQEKQRKYYNENKAIISDREKQKRKLLPKQKRVYNSMPIDEKKRRKSECDRRYRENNKEKVAEMKRNYYAKGGLEMAKKWQLSQKNNLDYVTKKKLRGRIYCALKRGVKSQSTIELLGCSIEYFKEYFQSKFTEDMNWDIYMKGGIHIDHIIPCAKFDLTNPEQQKKCFHYTNLQPLWAIDNLKKGTKLISNGAANN